MPERRALSQQIPSDPESYAEYESRLRTHLNWYYGECLGLDAAVVAQSIHKRIARERGQGLATLLDDLVGLRDVQMLDVGSGWGELLLSCIHLGAIGWGIEPSFDEVTIAELLLRSYGLPATIVCGRGESLPWSDDTFDLVTCQQVLEHVQDVERVVAEMIRVTRPGGSLFVSTPNYLFPYEGHYRMKWFPLLPKRMGAMVLRAKGRDPGFLLENVNYTTYWSMRGMWRAHGVLARNITGEMVRAGKHPAAIYENRVARRLALSLGLFPNVSWLITKPNG